MGLSELPDSLDRRSRNSQETHDQTKRAAVVKTVVAVTTIPATVSLLAQCAMHMEGMVITAYYLHWCPIKLRIVHLNENCLLCSLFPRITGVRMAASRKLSF